MPLSEIQRKERERMTREEAREELITFIGTFECPSLEAVEMAIEALQAPPITQRRMYQLGYRQAQKDRLKGEWNRLSHDTFHCILCGRTFIVTQGGDAMNFCPNCGADMRKDETDES